MSTCPVDNVLSPSPTSSPTNNPTLAPTPYSSTLRCAEIQLNVSAFTNIRCDENEVIDRIVFVGLGNPIGLCADGQVQSPFAEGLCSAPPSFGAYDGCIGLTTCPLLSGSASLVLPLHNFGFTSASLQRGCTYGPHSQLKITYACRRVTPAPSTPSIDLCGEGWGHPVTFHSGRSASSLSVAYQYYFSGWANSTVYLLHRTSPPTAAPTPFDCGSVLCSNECNIGQCGWSSNKQRCIPGGRTTAREAAARLRAGGGTCSTSESSATVGLPSFQGGALHAGNFASNRSALVSAPLDRQTWDNAEASCAMMGGHLASIHSIDELDYITGLPGVIETAGSISGDNGHCVTADGVSLEGWTDREGFSCVDYAFEGWCSPYGEESSRWDTSQWGSIESFAVGGYSAFDACLTCGCNRRLSAWIGASRARADDRNTHPFTFTYNDRSGSTSALEFAFVLGQNQSGRCSPLSTFGRPSTSCDTIWAGSGRGRDTAESEPRDLPCTPANFSSGQPCNGIESCVAIAGTFEDLPGKWEDADCRVEKLFVCKREVPASCLPTTTSTTTQTTSTTMTTTTTSATSTSTTTYDCTDHCASQCIGWSGYTNCSQITCSICCNDNVLLGCGWQSFTDSCVSGAVSRSDEESRGDCSAVRSISDCLPPSPPPPPPDTASLLNADNCHVMNQCGRCCNSSNGACGWSRRYGICKAGAITRASELDLEGRGFPGGCNQECPDYTFLSASPTAAITPPPTLATISPSSQPPSPQGIDSCGGIQCARCCRGICGWSSASGTCIEGGITRPDEEDQGTCNVEECNELFLADNFRLATGHTRAPTTHSPSEAPTSAPTAFELLASECALGSQCGRCCTGPNCGWSKKNGGFCKAGARTTTSEIGMGRDCSSPCPVPPR